MTCRDAGSRDREATVAAETNGVIEKHQQLFQTYLVRMIGGNKIAEIGNFLRGYFPNQFTLVALCL